MSKLKSNPTFKTKERWLRKNQTPTEALLWSKLRNRKLEGHKFQRQFGLGPYILDFYCQEKRLAIELDGGQHLDEDVEEYDKQRTAFLIRRGLTVLRFWNFRDTRRCS